MSAIFFSDVHLQDSGSVKTKLVLRFLQEVASRHDQVFILGDLFDVWPGTTEYLVRTFKPVLNSLADLVKEGQQVHYIEGNHDFRLGSYFTDTLGVQVHEDSFVTTLGGRRVHMSHGDLGNPKDVAYRMLRRVLRHPALHFALQPVPGQWLYQIGHKSSQLSRDYQRRNPQAASVGHAEKIRQTYRASASAFFHSGHDVVLMGHTHLPDDFTTTVEGRQCRYINLGDWVKHYTYLEFDGAEFYTRAHPIKE